MTPPHDEGIPAEGTTGRRNPLACYDGRFLVRVLGAALLIVALSILTRVLGLEKGGPWRITVGGAQALLLAWLIWITVGAIRRLDEMQYRIQLEAIAFAFAVSAIVMTGWGFLTKAGLPAVPWGPDTWLLMVLCWAFGLWLTRRRYR